MNLEGATWITGKNKVRCCSLRDRPVYRARMVWRFLLFGQMRSLVLISLNLSFFVVIL